jgi:hypothetical protein
MGGGWYPSKKENYLDLKVSELMNNKAHLTLVQQFKEGSGLKEIKQIKSGMNKNRK